jgi:hypothetical protein
MDILSDNSKLGDKDILQFAAAIIAGALIFLTISAFVTNAEEKDYRFISQVYGLSVIMIFSVSSWCILTGHRKLGLSFILFGLGVLAGLAGVLMIKILP